MFCDNDESQNTLSMNINDQECVSEKIDSFEQFCLTVDESDETDSLN